MDLGLSLCSSSSSTNTSTIFDIREGRPGTPQNSSVPGNSMDLYRSFYAVPLIRDPEGLLMYAHVWINVN